MKKERKVPIHQAKKNDVHKGTAEWFLLSQLFAVPSQRVGRVAAARLGLWLMWVPCSGRVEQAEAGIYLATD